MGVTLMIFTVEYVTPLDTDTHYAIIYNCDTLEDVKACFVSLYKTAVIISISPENTNDY
jgi:hypothetical protein